MNNAIGIVVAPLFLLLIAAVITVIVVIIYMAVYKRNINKALQENNGKHVSLPDAPSVIAIILIVVLFFNIFFASKQKRGPQPSSIICLSPGYTPRYPPYCIPAPHRACSEFLSPCYRWRGAAGWFCCQCRIFHAADMW